MVALTAAVDAAPAPQLAASPDLLPICVRVFKERCGLLDRQGRWAVEPQYAALYADGDYWKAQTPAGDVGVLDSSGRELIAPAFEYIGSFHEGLAPARKRNERASGYIDIHGNWVLPPRYESAGEFSEGVAATSIRTGDHREFTYIDREGRQAVPGTYESADAFRFGMAEITREAKPEYERALINRKGEMAVPWGQRYSLTPVLPNRVLDSGKGTLKLLDDSGRLVADIGSGRQPMDGRLFYSRDGDQLGLFDLQSGKPLVTPRNDWMGVVGDTFDSGVVWICAALPCQDGMLSVVDRAGQVVFTTSDYYDAVQPFSGGAAPAHVRGQGWTLVGPHGAVIAPPLGEAEVTPAWQSGLQTARPGDVWRFTTTDSQSTAPLSVQWVDTRGRTLASSKKLDCGITVVRNSAGDVIWPHDPKAACVIARLNAGKPAPEDASVPRDRVLAAAHAWQKEMAQEHGSGILSGRFSAQDFPGAAGSAGGEGAAAATPQAGSPNPLGWQPGPALLRLAGPASLNVPAGFLYMSPEGVQALRERLLDGRPPGARDDPARFPQALVMPVGGGWAARIYASEQGYIDTSGGLMDADSLRQRMSTHITDIFAQPQGAAEMVENLNWLRAPRLNNAEHRLDWSYTYLTMGSGIGHATRLAALALGRRYAVAMMVSFNGTGNAVSALLAQEGLDELASGVSFDKGQAYADAEPDDPRAKLRLEQYVTGPPTTAEKIVTRNIERSQQRQFWDTLLTRVAPLLALVLLLVAGARRRGNRK